MRCQGGSFSANSSMPDPSNCNNKGLIDTNLISNPLKILESILGPRWSAKKSVRTYPFITFYGIYYRWKSSKAIVHFSILPVMIGLDNIYLIKSILHMIFTIISNI